MITNLFNVWLVISVSAFSLMDILFWLNHENSLDLTEIWSWNKKERHSLIVFSDNCCHTSLLSGSSLKVNYKVKSEILSRNLLYSVPLKSMVLHRPLTEPFPPARLCDIRHWSSGRQWVAHPPPDADTSYYIRYASHLLVSSRLVRRVYKQREAVKFVMVDTSFPTFQFLLKSSSCVTGNKSCQLSS